MNTETQLDLRAEAETLVKKIGVIEMVKNAADFADKIDDDRITKLTEEISRLESDADPENLDGLRDIEARKSQRDLLAKKFAKDSAHRRKELADAAAATRDDRISNWLFAVEADLVARICATVRPFCENEAKVQFIAKNCDSILQLHRHQLALSSVTTRQNFGELLDVLKQFLSGTPPWIFTPATETKTH